MWYFNFVFHVVALLAVNLQLQAIGKGLVHIYGPEVKRYLAMDSNGMLFTTVSSYTSQLLARCLNHLERASLKP